ncbi:MAG: hypothetical protein U9P12_01695, partial [Verrucomicrobiota bacterium]|nr:hypothetical protein [Verrucomicrobiota bacterium]
AVRIAQGGGRWKADSVDQRRAGKGKDGLGEWLALNNEFSPVIIEVVRKKEYASFEVFQKETLANPFKWEDRVVEYHSTFYGTTLTLPVAADGPPLVDGNPVGFEPVDVYDSPYLKGVFGSGMVTIQKGESKLTFDFTKE